MVVLEFLPKDFGYVIFVIFYAIVNHIYLAIQVGKARKKYGVKYPAMYSDKEHLFNCYQRAHQNYLEGITFFLVQLIITGMVYPRFAAACGALYITSRFSYAWGYYTGDPEKRLNGNYGLFGLLGLIFGMLYVGVRQCGCMDQYLP